MASISGLSSSSANSIYGNRNIISGLASGMDTESMIENAVSGIQARITALQQKRTKVEWQQEAYRSIISKMVGFTQKYTSYSSPATNLFSSSFFTNAVKTTTNGENAGKVSAIGKSTSELSILGVEQLAAAARYSVSANRLTGYVTQPTISGKEFDLGASKTISAINGTLTVNYGTNASNSFTLNFGSGETFADAGELKAAIEKKLENEIVIFDGGATKKASECIKVEVDGSGNIAFRDAGSGGQSVTIGGATGKFKDAFGGDVGGSTLNVDGKTLTEEVYTYEHLSKQTMTFELDGVTKKITLPEFTGATTGKDFVDALQQSLDTAFGTDASGRSKIDMSNSVKNDADGKVTLQFEVAEGSSLTVSADAGGMMGLSAQNTSYLSTSKTLGDMPGILDGLTPTQGDDGKDYYAFVLNGVEIGRYTKDTALETVLMDINNNTEAGVRVNYSKTTNQFAFVAKETGAAGKIEMGSDLAKALFGVQTDPDVTATPGQDARLTVEVNGSPMELTRSTNTVDLDGMKVTLNGTFGTYGADDKLVAGSAEAVTFTTRSDADKIIDAVKSMIEDYNAMAKEIKDAYSTQPAEKNSATHTRYEPLTDEDKADMSESAIKAYEEKAKQGILFAESDLSTLYNKLRDAIAPSGDDGGFLRSIGIGTEYRDGLTTLALDENKLRTALENDSDGVKDAFTKSKENGSKTDGLMQSLKSTLDSFARTTGDSKGILVEKAGSPLVPSSVLKNSLKSQLENYDKQIESWSGKLSEQVDRYTTQFSRLEQLIAQMNSQSSMLMGLMGGTG